jgi:hypothetical protein
MHSYADAETAAFIQACGHSQAAVRLLADAD